MRYLVAYPGYTCLTIFVESKEFTETMSYLPIWDRLLFL
jgi:hypothetical protein